MLHRCPTLALVITAITVILTLLWLSCCAASSFPSTPSSRASRQTRTSPPTENASLSCGAKPRSTASPWPWSVRLGPRFLARMPDVPLSTALWRSCSSTLNCVMVSPLTRGLCACVREVVCVRVGRMLAQESAASSYKRAQTGAQRVSRNVSVHAVSRASCVSCRSGSQLQTAIYLHLPAARTSLPPFRTSLTLHLPFSPSLYLLLCGLTRPGACPRPRCLRALSGVFSRAGRQGFHLLTFGIKVQGDEKPSI